MGLISELRSALTPGKRRGVDTAKELAAVERGLQRLKGERKAAKDAIASGAERRRDLLLLDDGDEQIVALEAEIDRHHRTLERLEIVEDELLRRLDELRDDRRSEQLAAFREEIGRPTAALVVAARAAAAAMADYRAVRNRMLTAGFAHEAALLLPTPPHIGNGNLVASPELIDIFEAEAERCQAVRTTAPAPRASNPRQPGRPGPTPHGDIGKRVAVPGGEPRPRPAPPAPPAPARSRPRRPLRPLRRETAREGERVVTLLRSGVDYADGDQSRIGDQISLSLDQADLLVQRGAADYATAPEAAPIEEGKG